MSLINDALQHMYFTMPHRRGEIEEYCENNNIPLATKPHNTFNPDEFFGDDDD